MMLTDLTDAEVVLLYEGSDPVIRGAWNVIKFNRFCTLTSNMMIDRVDPNVMFDYVAKRAAQIQVDQLLQVGAANG